MADPAPRSSRYDAVVVGSGPNGLAAAITLAREGLGVCLLEAETTIGGGTRSLELTLPGFVHDLCSAVHPMGVGSPFFRTLPLAEHGLTWIHPPLPLAHPLDEGPAARLERGVEATAAALGPDARAYRRFVGPFAERWDNLAEDLLAPLSPPRHPVLASRFFLRALRSATASARRFRSEPARALVAGNAAHGGLPLDRPPTGALALALMALAHAVGWPIPRGGTQRLADALAACLVDLGGEIVAGFPVRSLRDIPPSRAVLLDVTPAQLLKIAGQELPPGYRRRLARFRYGPAAFKLDWALAGPIPWRDPACAEAGTVHLGGTLAEIAASERKVWEGRTPERPFVLLSQPSRFDPQRAPANGHTAWAYCHVPRGSTVDMTDRMEAQVERFAPGFRDLVLARSVIAPAELERRNANHVDGSIDGGLHDLRQMIARPVPSLDPYATPLRGVYLCSSSTPPGSGVHGMCGFHAARSALRRSFGAG
jgi:phytoene dehydrogenase-like protein